MNKSMKKKGFTLVELLVVIAILAILASVSVVGYLGFVDNAKQSNAENELAQYKTIVLSKLADGIEEEGEFTFKYDVEAGTITVTKGTNPENNPTGALYDLMDVVDTIPKSDVTVNNETSNVVSEITYKSKEGKSATWNIKTGKISKAA